MVVARQLGRQVEIKNLDDLLKVVQTALENSEPLTLSDEVHDIVITPRSDIEEWDVEPSEDPTGWEESTGSWAGLIDVDEFMRRVREGRGSNRPIVNLDPPTS